MSRHFEPGRQWRNRVPHSQCWFRIKDAPLLYVAASALQLSCSPFDCLVTGHKMLQFHMLSQCTLQRHQPTPGQSGPEVDRPAKLTADGSDLTERTVVLLRIPQHTGMHKVCQASEPSLHQSVSVPELCEGPVSTSMCTDAGMPGTANQRLASGLT